MNKNILDVFSEKIINDNYLVTKEDIYKIIELPEIFIYDLIAASHRITKNYKKDKVFTCAIINAKSGSCSQDCAFCAQSSYHKVKIDSYQMLLEDDIFEYAIKMEKAGATQFSIVTSGHRLNQKEINCICKVMKIISYETDLNICASLGMITIDNAYQLKENGLKRYHHNLETAKSYFDKICTTHKYEEDVETIKNVQKSGLKICSGGIIGLGENWDDRIELGFLLNKLNVDSIPLNFLNPISGTKLENQPILDPFVALKTIAIFRFINFNKDITICGGREITLRDLQAFIFPSGANGIMIGNYLTTKGRDSNSDMDMIDALKMDILAI